MDQIKTGRLIRQLRIGCGYTQAKLASLLGVSDKAVSKWERGCSAPDVALLPELARALNTGVEVLLKGESETNSAINGNMKHCAFYVCNKCGNIIVSAEKTDVLCCGSRLKAMTAQSCQEPHSPEVTRFDDGLFISMNHEMTRRHYISFFAFIDSDTVYMKKLYPEWDAQFSLPFYAHGQLLFYCNEHGLFAKNI